MSFKKAAVSVAIASITLAGCSREPTSAGGDATPAAGAPAWKLTVETLSAPTGPATMLPRLTASERGVILSWVVRDRTKAELRFAERLDSGWSAPTTIASSDKWFLSYADPPTVLRRPNGTLVANWLVSTNPDYEGSDLNFTYSQDNGKTWARAIAPHHDGTEQQHAFPSFYELPDNRFGVMWLDGRDVQPTDALPNGGPMVLRYAEYDQQWKRTGEGVVAPRTCECCSTTTAMTSDGVIAAFRDRSEKEIRDISVTRLENGKWTTPATVHDDGWEVYSCPVNGPVLSARGRNAAVAWFTAKDDKGQAWAAFSSDAGRTWGEPIRLDDGVSLGRVGIELLDDGSAVASWVEIAGDRGQFKVRRIEPSGDRSDAVPVSSSSVRLSMDTPRMARHGDDLFFAWTERADGDDSDAASQVHTASAHLP
ncbi:MAG: exo-alpha-sialidase [Acidobacteria bacterium]|nr:exo-alpha-sialidase [Acidobacteriota bacterium]